MAEAENGGGNMNKSTHLPDFKDVSPGFFDVHCSAMDIFGHFHSIPDLMEEMKKNGVTAAVMHINQYRKVHGEMEPIKPTKHNDDQYPVLVVHRDMDLKHALESTDTDGIAIIPSACGFDLTCQTSKRNLATTLQHQYFGAIGPILFRTADVMNNMLVQPAMKSNISQKFFQQIPSGMPIILRCNASSVSTKPYAVGYEYIHEVDEFLETNVSNPVIWLNAGVFDRGTWEDYESVLRQMLVKHGNLFCSISPEFLPWIDSHKCDWLKAIIKDFPTRFVCGTSGLGTISASQYGKCVQDLKEFFKGNEQVLFQNACDLYLGKVKMQWDHSVVIDSKVPEKMRAMQTVHDPFEFEVKEPLPKAKYTIIDVHLHLLDFLQKSSGTKSAVIAMDDCGVSKAIMFGMPCCKKWSVWDKFPPLYYQDNNADCYFYSYADQMIADAWLALDNQTRARFAPMIASFNPTDRHSIAHVRRMYNKYPGMWRGVGEVMCRHDDLTSLLQDKECPTANHAGMAPIYEFCVEKDLPVMVHHNADKVNDDDIVYAYVHEIEDVLKRYPTLKFVWVHCGVSRKVHEENHHEIIENLLDQFKCLRVDISWVVWEEVILGPDGLPKQVWIDLIQKHNDRVMIGSDQVGQFVNRDGKNLLKSEITKYYSLLDRLTEEAAENVSWRNAENLYFKDWELPNFRRQAEVYCCECLDAKNGVFIDSGEKY